MSHLILTDTGDREPSGLRILALDIVGDDGKILKTWHVNSGQAYNQELQTDAGRKSGDYSPIPEHVYSLGSLEFAGGKFDWADSWGAGLGDLWCAINPVGGTGNTAALGFHLDENRATAPGSAGCVVFRTKADAESWVAAMRRHDPDRLYVNWGLGTVKIPGAAPAAPVDVKQTLEIVAHSGKLRARWGGEPWRDLDSLKIVGDYS